MTEFIDTELYLPDFSDIWFTNCDSRYRCLKGARSTGKTYDFIGLEPYFKLFSDERRNILMVRQNDIDNAQSNYSILKNIAYKYGIAHLFKFIKSPHMIVRRATGQVILFAGMNNVENITGTSVEHGYWTDIYFEEASQLKSYEDFRVVDGSIRIPNYESDLKVQITFLFNAWDVGHWLYDVFFKERLEDSIEQLENNRFMFYKDDKFNIGYGYGLALHISSYKCNPYLSQGQIDGALEMKNKAYDIYLVENLGCWGNIGERTYTHWSDSLVVPAHTLIRIQYDTIVVGIDFGMSNGEGKIKYSEDNAKRLGSANTMQLVGVVNNWDRIVPMDEYFDSNEGRTPDKRKTGPQIQKEMISTLKIWKDKYNIYGVLNCYVDCADPGGFRDSLALEARNQGLFNVNFIASSKIPILSRVYFENYLMSLGLLTPSENCPNLKREIKNARKAADGRVREDIDDHGINAFEYAWLAIRKKLKRWHTFKEPSIGGYGYDA